MKQVSILNIVENVIYLVILNIFGFGGRWY